MSGAAAFFWTLAGVHVLLAMRIQVRAAVLRSQNGLRHANSQRKDSWLSTAIMLAAILFDETSLAGWAYLKVKEFMVSSFGNMPNATGVIYLLGTITMAWLVKRAIQRLNLPPAQW